MRACKCSIIVFSPKKIDITANTFAKNTDFLNSTFINNIFFQPANKITKKKKTDTEINYF